MWRYRTHNSAGNDYMGSLLALTSPGQGVVAGAFQIAVRASLRAKE